MRRIKTVLNIRGFSNCFGNFGSLTNVMARRLANRFISECSGYFMFVVCGTLVCECIFTSKCVKISFIKIQKYAFTKSFRNHLTITYSFGKLALWQMSFRKASIFYHALHFCSFRSYAPNSGRFGFEDSEKTLTCTCKSKGYDQVTKAKTVLDIQCKFDRIISVVIRRLYLVPMVKV